VEKVSAPTAVERGLVGRKPSGKVIDSKKAGLISICKKRERPGVANG